MNKRELVADVAARTGREPEDVAPIVDAMVDAIVGAVAGGERVVIQGFGTFVRQARARRVARDINAERKVVVPATHVPLFRAGKPFRDLVASPRRRRPGTSARASKRSRPTVLRRAPTRTRSAAAVKRPSRRRPG